MVNAKFELPDGTVITVDGSVSEVESLLLKVTTAQYPTDTGAKKPKKSSKPKTKKTTATSEGVESETVDHKAIANKIHDCEETEIISSKILDSKNVLNRVLLPLYFVHKYFDPNWVLSSGDVEIITDDLGVKVAITSASTMLSGGAKKYVSGDAVRKQGGKGVRYKLNRPGIQYMTNLLSE